ncbi:ATP-binding protein [Hydrogenophaga sp. 5NK40-0174]|uniref:ATP-binding protein n=1 Tax=Hydrogenophaga sp. 5NK40-0174 TaxID=3127649 RepID=UPI00310812DF
MMRPAASEHSTDAPQVKARGARRAWDSLFLRIFLIMWVVLFVSHLTAFSLAVPWATGRDDAARRLQDIDKVPVPSLPLGGLLPGPGAGRPDPANGDEPPPGRRRGLPARALWLDYALRFSIMAMGAYIAARWLSGPIRRLGKASVELNQALAQGKPMPSMDEAAGTVEVREAAGAFNQMAKGLQHQFNQRSLHMAAVSHDLRTPLTRLRLRIEQLPDEAAQAASRDIAEMDELIDASLAVMREQAGNVESQRLDLAALVISMVDDRVEQGQDVECETAPEDLCLPVRVHAASVRRIIDNLVSNALRYGHRARLHLHQTEHWAELSIDDDGPGIAPALREQAFQPWVRLGEGGDQSATSGSGLGLAIARDLAEREGGSLDLLNREEGGLRVTLRLPVA